MQERLCRLKLSEAVAASAAVPGIFPPLTLRGLYRSGRGEEIVVELADGGVFDNQGVGALCREGCTDLIVSDGSGQLEDQLLLSRRAFEVVSRASSLMMDKIREEIYCRIRQEFNGRLSLFHLRQAFQPTRVFPHFPGPINRPGGMVYRLSSLRTDLDSFSDAEAFSLMYHGYTLALSRLLGEKWKNYSPREEWNFLAIREVLEKRPCWLMRRLEVGRHRLFKPFLLLAEEHPWLSWAGAASALFLFGALLWGLWGLDLELPAPLLFVVPIFFLPLDLWFRRFWFLRRLDPLLGLLGLLSLTPIGIWLRLWRNTAGRLFLYLGRASGGRAPSP